MKYNNVNNEAERAYRESEGELDARRLDFDILAREQKNDRMRLQANGGEE